MFLCFGKRTVPSLTAQSFHFTDSAVMIPRPHERGDGRPHRGVAGPARSEPETRRVVVFPAHTCEPNLERVTSKGKKYPPLSVINVLSTVRLDTESDFRL